MSHARTDALFVGQRLRLRARAERESPPIAFREDDNVVLSVIGSSFRRGSDFKPEFGGTALVPTTFLPPAG